MTTNRFGKSGDLMTYVVISALVIAALTVVTLVFGRSVKSEFAVETTAPVFRAGLLTDTHITDDPASCGKVRRAMALFAREKTDLVCHLGDLADVYSPKGFVEYRRIVEEAFGGNPPETYYAFGGHDRNGYTLKPGEKNREETVWDIMRRAFKVRHGLYDILEFRGYPFVIVQEYIDEKRARELLEKAARDYPTGPIFLLFHEPAWGTIDDSWSWGNVVIRRLCETCPRIVHLSGHCHGSLRNERKIWQGKFTELNLGCLQNWLGTASNLDWSLLGKRDDGVATMDVYKDRIVFRRFSVTTGKEYRPEARWTIPLAYGNPVLGPYRPDVRKAASSAPVWPEGAQLVAEWKAGPHGRGVAFRVPSARHPDGGIYRSTLSLYSEDGARLTLQQALGEFWKITDRTDVTEFFLDEAYFRPGRRYRAEVKAENFYGGEGAGLSVEVAGPADRGGWREVWQTGDAMSACAFSKYDWIRRRPLPADAVKGGIRAVNYDMFLADVPSAALPEGDPVGTRYRLEMSMDDDHLAEGHWLVEIYRGDTLKRIPNSTRLMTAEGKAGPIAYVFHFTKDKSGPLPVAIVMSYGLVKSDFRIGRLVLSRFNSPNTNP